MAGSYIKSLFRIDYASLDEYGRLSVYNRFVEECFFRVGWISLLACLGELILMCFDFAGGFFSVTPINHLNLLAEIIIIVSSGLTALINRNMRHRNAVKIQSKARLIWIYKVLLTLSIEMFIFTDIYVRYRPLGAYMVFLFILLIMPFYKAVFNICQYLGFGIFLSIFYFSFVPDADGAALFSVLAIILAFALTTECLRQFFIKKLISSECNQLMTSRFENLASQSIIALSNAVEAKDIYTKGHSQRVAKYSRMIAKRMGMDREKQSEIYYIGLLHDIGKIGVRDTVINKNGRLTEEEYEEIKRHPVVGYDILKNITEIPDISMGAKWHHEKYDGSGYPDGLKGEEIPLIARIIAVADAYDAMTSTRSYRDVLPQKVVREEIEKNLGKQFAPDIAKIMLDIIDEDVYYKLNKKGK